MPSDQEMRATLIKQGRRGLLDVLNQVYPRPLDYDTICGVFINLDEHYIRRDLAYLVDKGYVEWANRGKNVSMKYGSYRLTAVGEEIAQKINTDPALEP